MAYSQELVLSMYLDYVNNFLTVGVFAEHYGLSESDANAVITAGRSINEALALLDKQMGIS